MKGYCKKCGRLIDETEQTPKGCVYCDAFETYYEIKHDGVITRRKL